MPENTLYEDHPSMFRNHPVWFIICVLLIAAFGLGLLILLVWWIRCIGTKLTVTDERTILRKGILSKYTSEVYHSDVRSVQLSQRFMERLFGVGTIAISSAGQGDIEIVVPGIPSPNKIKEIIDGSRRQQRK